jgi:hypothetical protein
MITDAIGRNRGLGAVVALAALLAIGSTASDQTNSALLVNPFPK